MRKLWPYTKRGTTTGSSNTASQPKTGTKLSRLYQNITELPLTNFIDAYVDNKLSSLIIEGYPTELEILQTWDKIRIQYADAVADPQFKNYAITKGQAAQLELTMEMATMLINELRLHYCTNLHERINKLFSYKFNFDLQDNEKYENELRKAERRMGGWKIELSLKKSAVEKMEKGMQGGEVNREYFQGLKLTIHTHFKVPLINENTTTWEFCELLKRIRKDIDNTKPKQRGR